MPPSTIYVGKTLTASNSGKDYSTDCLLCMVSLTWCILALVFVDCFGKACCFSKQTVLNAARKLLGVCGVSGILPFNWCLLHVKYGYKKIRCYLNLGKEKSH